MLCNYSKFEYFFSATFNSLPRLCITSLGRQWQGTNRFHLVSLSSLVFFCSQLSQLIYVHINIRSCCSWISRGINCFSLTSPQPQQNCLEPLYGIEWYSNPLTGFRFSNMLLSKWKHPEHKVLNLCYLQKVPWKWTDYKWEHIKPNCTNCGVTNLVMIRRWIVSFHSQSHGQNEVQ